jgi:hypothetical protein
VKIEKRMNETAGMCENKEKGKVRNNTKIVKIMY